ncbi:uncharacterized protein LOC120084732 [Benincasa hispida]|uniref:uncharacterized protein LOC120084732 n=1 Tax=Benincasa hispida TaxID=102211 RepID=UPI001902527F|nr:uncharacterized protein LOC120084732 [Benincasa hispida]
MIEDGDTLNTFPWGRLVFTLTIEFFRRVAQTKSTNCTLHGFPQVLLCWAYEIISKLYEQSVVRIVTQVNEECLRMLRWRLTKKLDWNYLQECIFKANDFKVVPLNPFEDELHSNYFQYFANEPLEVIEERWKYKRSICLDDEEFWNEQEVQSLGVDGSNGGDIGKINEDLESLKEETVKISKNIVMLFELFNSMNEKLATKNMEKQSQDSFHPNKPPIASLQRTKDEMNIQQLEDNKVVYLLYLLNNTI